MESRIGAALGLLVGDIQGVRKSVARESRKAQPRLWMFGKEWKWECREASNVWTSASVDRDDRVVLCSSVPCLVPSLVYWRYAAFLMMNTKALGERGEVFSVR